MIAGLSLSGQDLIVTYQQNVAQMVNTIHPTEQNVVTVPAYFTRFSPGIKASWRGITAGANYHDDTDLFFWEAGYTLTITPQVCLRTHGDGFKLGYTYGATFTEPEGWIPSGHRYQFTLSLGYQKDCWYGEVFLRENNAHYETFYGIGIGYAFL